MVTQKAFTRRIASPNPALRSPGCEGRIAFYENMETGKVSSLKCFNKDNGCDANVLMSLFNNTCVNWRGTI